MNTRQPILTVFLFGIGLILSACSHFVYTGNKVAVCHHGQTLWLDEEMAEAHRRHGDSTGACDAALRDAMIPTRY